MAGTSTLDEARRLAAVLVTPDTRGIGLLEFHQIDRAREAGRVAGRAVVAALQERLPQPDPDLPAPREAGGTFIDVSQIGKPGVMATGSPPAS